MLRPSLSPEYLRKVKKQSYKGRADKRQANILVQAWLGQERPLCDLQCGRHVHQDGRQNRTDQAHLHEGLQEEAQGDDMAFLPFHVLI